MVEIKYTSPAFPPYGIRVGKTYRFIKKDKGYAVADVRHEIDMTLDEIKMLFAPVDKTWAEVLKTSKKTKED